MDATPSRSSRLWAIVAAVVVLVFGFLPIVNWIHGGREWPRYGSDLEGWLAGTAIAVGAGVLYVIVARRVPSLWRSDALAPVIRIWVRRPRLTTAALSLAALAVYVCSARYVFSGRPLLVDEVIQLYQARLFASGRIAGTVDAVPELFSALFLLERNGRVFSQFPPGGPAVLALGVALRAVWLIVPLCGALAVACFASFTRRVEADRPGVSLLASILFAFAPYMIFMSGSQMNHVPTLLGVVLALLGLERATSTDTPQRSWLLWGFVCGIALGFAATIRPPDAAAFAAPIALALLWAAVHDRRRIGALLASGVGVAIPVGLMLWYNARTTGAPLLFGYEAMWGKSHAIGFHAAPWGAAHTPARGLELLSLYFLRLQTYLFETPIPSLVFCLVALALATRLRRMDRVLLAGSGALVVLYFAYWHDGFYLGPRFFMCLLPVLALWSARIYAEWRARWGRGESYRVLVASSVVCVVIAMGLSIPLRVDQYRSGLKTMRWDLEGAARAAGVRDALVFVRESWGAQLMVRLWAIGLSHPEAQALYRWVDACALERGLDSLERTGERGAAARALLLPLLADSARVVQTPFSADSSERVLPGSRYGPRCVRRLQEDHAGFTVYLPFIVAESDNVVYARDLHARDSVLLARYPSRPVYLVRPPTDADGVPPRFWRVSRDSLRADWSRVEAP
jgi:dolichyl-phosphate-mannose-protein mannosyltransferase